MNAAVQRQMMVDGQVRTNEVSGPALLEALYEVPREMFLPKELADVAYIDREAVLAGGRVLLTPMVMAKLIQALVLSPNEKVLDIAGGTGLSAAVMAKAGAKVVALEDNADFTAAAKINFAALDLSNATTATGPLTGGAPEFAPFDAILINGSVDFVSRAILEQLRDHGRLVVIKGQGRSAKAMLYERSGDVYAARNLFDASAPALPDFQKAVEFVF